MSKVSTLQSWIGGSWMGSEAGLSLHSAIDNTLIYHTHAESVDAQHALDYARRTGVPALMALDFQQRAACLRALASHIQQHREELYTIAHLSGATRADSKQDICAGIGVLNSYAGIAASGLPSGNVLHEAPAMSLCRRGGAAGTHIMVPRGGVALHINPFNLPVWSLLEKFAASFLAAMPCIVKPATCTSYLAEALVRLIDASGLLPKGALQLAIGPADALLARLQDNDAVSFTGSDATATTLRKHPTLLARSVQLSLGAASLNCAILGPDVRSGEPEFELLVDAIVRSMTLKAGQDGAAIRRVMVPHGQIEALTARLRERLAAVVIGDPAQAGVQMGPLASQEQRSELGARVRALAEESDVVCGQVDGYAPSGDRVRDGAFAAPTLLLCRGGARGDAVHEIEAFGPVCALMPYADVEEALALAARGRGSLASTLATRDPKLAAYAVPRLASSHGRVLVLEREVAAAGTDVLASAHLKYGGPGRAGCGEQLGGLRAISQYLQRSALQGSPTMLTAVTGEYVRGAAVRESVQHPFRKHFDELEVGESLLTHRRTVCEADIVAFGGISGDYFYMHFDEIAARDSQFGRRIAHGYFVLAAAAGLFVSPAPGPVLANYGLDDLRFVAPVGIGDTIRARLTCKRKVDRQRRDDKGVGQGVVSWDVQVTNQNDELVASYDILTLVAKRAGL